MKKSPITLIVTVRLTDIAKGVFEYDIDIYYDKDKEYKKLSDMNISQVIARVALEISVGKIIKNSDNLLYDGEQP